MIVSNKWVKFHINEKGSGTSSWYLRSKNNLFITGNSLEISVARVRYDGLGLQTYKVPDKYFNRFSISFEI